MKDFLNRKRAFTLAEILIALTIIGVVSALTIPNIMRNTQAAQYKTAFKKGMAELNQAIAEYINGEGRNLAQIEYSSAPDAGISRIFTKYLGAKEIKGWPVTVHLTLPTFNDESNNKHITIDGIKNVRNVLLDDSEEAYKDRYKYYMLSDNIAVIVPNKLNGCGRPHVNVSENLTKLSYAYSSFGNYGCLIYVDTNGPKGPNQSIVGVSSIEPTEDACAYIVRPDEAHGYMLTNKDKEYCQLTDDAVTDIFPVVLFNEMAYPATVAGYWVLNDLIGHDFGESKTVVTPDALSSDD